MRVGVSDAAQARAALVEAIKSDDEPAYAHAIAALKVDPSVTRTILDELTTHPDVEIRDWLALNVASVAPDVAGTILRRLIRDRDPDTRSAAMDALVGIDPQARQELRSTYVRQLRGKDFYDAIRGMWGLAALRDRDSIPKIREAGRREASKGRTFVGITADVVVLLIEGRHQEILDSLTAHDHDRTSALASAARLIGTPAAIDALRECLSSAPDADCRKACEYQLERITAGDAA